MIQTDIQKIHELILAPITVNLRLFFNSEHQKYLIQYISYFYAQHSLDSVIVQCPDDFPDNTSKIIILAHLNSFSHEQQLQTLQKIRNYPHILAVSTFSVHAGLLQSFDFVMQTTTPLVPTPLSLYNSKLAAFDAGAASRLGEIFLDPRLRTFVKQCQFALKVTHFQARGVLVQGCSMGFDSSAELLSRVLARFHMRQYCVPQDVKDAVLMCVGSRFLAQVVFRANGDAQKWSAADVEEVVRGVMARFEGF
ncbi:hypothetical protein SS50377_27504 [Spironucleus salmonicida]|uniref:Uncharacterized protein n=1 Tax=Spironucleus salmonicida TaxID=348837 RepID=V6LRL0_9EUKA|nr:hypothetical protein SS50377_27504 [Spironucleus salmonicida]|eukprot:EST46903.1 Hypothetical protein SS50377_13056 [Spironucleus salmonicida]